MICVFDMDGVLTNSATLGGIEAVNALSRTKPGKRILSVDTAEELYPGFAEVIERYRPFLVHGHEFLAICDYFRKTSPSIKSRGRFESEVENYKQEIGVDEYDQLCKAFADVRKSLPDEDPNKVIDLLIVYDGIREIIASAIERYPVYVSSSNHLARKRLELLSLGFNLENVYTKATDGKTKREHLEKIAQREGVKLGDITMIEDSLPEIVRLHDLGVNLVMASWGYNNDAQCNEGARHGARVLNQEGFLNHISL